MDVKKVQLVINDWINGMLVEGLVKKHGIANGQVFAITYGYDSLKLNAKTIAQRMRLVSSFANTNASAIKAAMETNAGYLAF